MFYSTCADPKCKGVMEVTFAGQTSHPNCRPDEIFTLTADWCAAAQRDDIAEANRLQAEIDAHDGVPELGASALWYASVGWEVFPLRPGDKRPATKNGLKDATTDADQIREWWSATPSANIGVVTGQWFDIADVDGPEGIRSLVDLGEDVLGEVHGKVGTPRGLHFLLPVSGSGNRVGVRPGIDFRGKLGYCVAPPSIVDGKRYVWLIQPSPKIMEVER